MTRTFEQIVKDAGTDTEVAEALGTKLHQPRDWRLRNSVPPEFFAAFAANGWATLEELAAAAEVRAAGAREKRHGQPNGAAA